MFHSVVCVFLIFCFIFSFFFNRVLLYSSVASFMVRCGLYMKKSLHTMKVYRHSIFWWLYFYFLSNFTFFWSYRIYRFDLTFNLDSHRTVLPGYFSEATRRAVTKCSVAMKIDVIHRYVIILILIYSESQYRMKQNNPGVER